MEFLYNTSVGTKIKQLLGCDWDLGKTSDSQELPALKKLFKILEIKCFSLEFVNVNNS